ncbi:putative baseplate assembly protein [Aliiglaciecola lipolytica]|uniref:putative baseplate assembly protein n=1 Tax=Aliiglaciecola lipolytica TaxID=477689 RepID=UPI001C08BC78|nr:putative baseplate assembly protein [Aliiglaciecola lipolytica]MBU2876693.1 putative baseplate assembly protein [Aliiglaciecola lipolytica]
MSLNKPILDDRSYQQIRDELIARIPVYAPEWTDHNPSDPGIALIELFSYLTENLLYRFNQIPDSTKIEFLRLLQIPLKSAYPATAMLSLSTKEPQGVAAKLASQASAGDLKFTTLQEVHVLPVSALGVLKVIDQVPDEDSEEGIFYQQAAASVDASATQPYHTETIWQDEPGLSRDMNSSVDGILWVAILAEKAIETELIKQNLLAHPKAPLLLNIGFIPEIRLEDDLDHHSADFALRFRCPGEGMQATGSPVSWQISTGRINSQNKPIYYPLQIQGDTTNGLEKEGVVRLQMPTEQQNMSVYQLDDVNMQGVGDFPPILDDDTQSRVICWLRAFRNDDTAIGKITFIGANTTLAEQAVQGKSEFIGTGNGQPNQVYALNHQQVLANSVRLQVEEPQGWTDWHEVEGFYASTESDRHFMLDKQGGQIRFGTGINGAVVQIGQRVRVIQYRYGGGRVGNVAAAAINKLVANPLVKVSNPLNAYGGTDAETLEAALERIPSELRRRNRAVTRSDFKELALQAPGADLARAEVLPRYHPQLPQLESAGVVSVVVWPKEDKHNPNAPLPNKNQLRSVCRFLDARRLITTEIYVLPPKYVPVAIAVGVKVKNGFGIDAVRHWVELALRQFLAPLPPYGPGGHGWPLGRRVHNAELEAAAHQVEGVEYLEGLELVGWDSAGNEIPNTVTLQKNEVPELIAITVENGPITLSPGEIISPTESDAIAVPVPVIKEVC